MACLREETNATQETLAVAARDRQPDSREGQAGLYGVAERFVVAWKPGNAGGVKEPQFKDNAGNNEGPGHWRKPTTRIAQEL